jgi:hypothetical protein
MFGGPPGQSIMAGGRYFDFKARAGMRAPMAPDIVLRETNNRPRKENDHEIETGSGSSDLRRRG